VAKQYHNVLGAIARADFSVVVARRLKDVHQFAYREDNARYNPYLAMLVLISVKFAFGY
jgi:hypothetical protein